MLDGADVLPILLLHLQNNSIWSASIVYSHGKIMFHQIMFCGPDHVFDEEFDQTLVYSELLEKI